MMKKCKRCGQLISKPRFLFALDPDEWACIGQASLDSGTLEIDCVHEFESDNDEEV